MHLELAPLQQGYSLVIRNTPKGQAAIIAPTHGLTPTGPRVQQGGNNNDYWKYNEQGYLVRVHTRDKKAMFIPDHGKQSTCPAPLDRFDNYRRTVIHREQQKPVVLEDQYETLTKEQRNREPTGGLWQGETWLRIPEQKEGVIRIQQEQAQSKQSTSTPVLIRHTGKQPVKETTVPPPEKVQHTTD